MTGGSWGSCSRRLTPEGRRRAGNTGGAREAGPVPAGVLTPAQPLAPDGNKLKLELDRLLAEVRAA